jgi:hypothetical protein
VKLHLDEDLSPKIAEQLRKRALDAVSAIEAGNAQLSDREQLACAARDGRCLVTRNARHYILLAREAIQRHESHAGIILCPSSMRGFEVKRIADALTRVAKRFPEGLAKFDVLYL